MATHKPNDQSKAPANPGCYPFTRGIHPDMYRGRLWTMRQYAGFGSAKEANQRFHYLKSMGQTGLSVAFDLPTQLGLDSDDVKASGEVGRVGVAIASLDDMQLLFQGISLEQVSTSMTINATASMLLTFYALVAKEQGVELNKLRGTVQNDILKEFIARGNYVFPPTPSLRLAVDTIQYCQQQMHAWYPISISGYHIREAGADAVQELAFTFANALTYVRACVERGLDLASVLKRVSFFFSVDNNFLEEIAKFRAARQLWATLLTKHFGIKPGTDATLQLRFHAQTGGSTLTAKQPRNNLVRVSLQAMAAVLGGAQSLHTNAWDEALSLPTNQSALLALRTQQIIAEESGVALTVDPCGGAYAIEDKTRELYEAADKLIVQMDAMGAKGQGSIAAIESGYFQHAIAQSAYQQQQSIEAGNKIVVGVNRYVQPNEKLAIKLWSLDEKSQLSQIKRLSQLKAKRPQATVTRKLNQLQKAATTRENLVPYIMDCAAHQATLGEMTQALRDVFGSHQERGL